jgi:hypothetical protein
MEPEAASGTAAVAEDQIFGHGEALDEPEVLVHHAHAGVDRVARGVELDRLAVQQDLALVRAVEPAEDVRERRLACAVLAEERVHLARGGGEVDACRSLTPGKRFVIPMSWTSAAAPPAVAPAASRSWIASVEFHGDWSRFLPHVRGAERGGRAESARSAAPRDEHEHDDRRDVRQRARPELGRAE